ncbi:hypothetical protein HBI65_135460 [Parastagonospora nodorum]|nr:hypothetical protein HBI65_135460 [Parastagonospora nodorum]
MSRNPTVELWILYAVGVSFTFVRTYARIVAVGVRELHPDDYLIWVAVLIYSAQCTLGHSYGTAAHGLANNRMSDVQRGVLSRDDPEYAFRNSVESLIANLFLVTSSNRKGRGRALSII